MINKDLTLETAKINHVNMVINICGQNKTKAAKLLGINRESLHRILRTYRLRKEIRSSCPSFTKQTKPSEEREDRNAKDKF